MDRKSHAYSITILCSLCILLFLIFPSVHAQETGKSPSDTAFENPFNEGERLFRSNRPDQALPFLEKALAEKGTPPVIYNYLGTACIQTGNLKKALEVFLRGTEAAGTDKKSLYYNAGNTAFLLGDYAKAYEYFSFSLAADSLWASSYLNRANTQVYLQKYAEAIDDYTQYLALAPDAPQGGEIKRMIGALNDELALREREKRRKAEEAERIRLEEERLRAERERLESEKARIAAEQERLAAEKAAAEAERRRRILEEVSASLQTGSTTNVSAGTEGVLDYEYEEIELE
ncbi:tetratricopeptide repeat protein [Treponema sp. HNW]|uniref:tetratricopeptide repeat protein n=1 Tax=Treponema sp. HNW TaxID=3116654 RepID=UPI003D0A9B4A